MKAYAQRVYQDSLGSNNRVVLASAVVRRIIAYALSFSSAEVFRTCYMIAVHFQVSSITVVAVDLTYVR